MLITGLLSNQNGDDEMGFEKDLEAYFQGWLWPYVQKCIRTGEACTVLAPLPLVELHRLALVWLTGKAPCVVCKKPSVIFKRRNLSERQALFIPLCADCGELDDIAIDALFAALHKGKLMPKPNKLTRLIDEAIDARWRQ